MKTLSRKSISSLSAILLVGVLAVGQGSLSLASAEGTPQVTSAVCTHTSIYSIKLTGSFPSVITDIAVNYLTIDQVLWTQLQTEVVIQVSGADEAPSNLMIVYGGEFLLVDVVCGKATATTENGGTLPNTGSNNYNYLVAGIGLALFGTRGLLRRKLIQE